MAKCAQCGKEHSADGPLCLQCWTTNQARVASSFGGVSHCRPPSASEPPFQQCSVRICRVCGREYFEAACEQTHICHDCRLTVEASEPRPDKPPLGIMPEWLWKEQRVWELIACLARHRPAGESPVDWRGTPTEAWFGELRRLLLDLLRNKES